MISISLWSFCHPLPPLFYPLGLPHPACLSLLSAQLYSLEEYSCLSPPATWESWNKPLLSPLLAGTITNALSPSQFLSGVEMKWFRKLSLPWLGEALYMPGMSQKQEGVWVGGGCITELISSIGIKDPSRSRGEIRADEREDLKELLSHYTQKNVLKTQAQTCASHPWCILVSLI